MPLPLSGLLVVSLEQAVAAPMCTCRLAGAAARVIKVERPEGDFARYYDKLAVPHTCVPRTRSAPSPLVGEGWGGGSLLSRETSHLTPTPTPNPSPQGSGSTCCIQRFCCCCNYLCHSDSQVVIAGYT